MGTISISLQQQPKLWSIKLLNLLWFVSTILIIWLAAIATNPEGLGVVPETQQNEYRVLGAEISNSSTYCSMLICGEVAIFRSPGSHLSLILLTLVLLFTCIAFFSTSKEIICRRRSWGRASNNNHHLPSVEPPLPKFLDPPLHQPYDESMNSHRTIHRRNTRIAWQSLR
jgi:hypothetical protein